MEYIFSFGKYITCTMKVIISGWLFGEIGEVVKLQEKLLSSYYIM